jgi:hypothetical protein
MKKLILLMPAAVLLMTGCGSMVSISPLYSDGNAIQEPGLVGTWQAGDGDDILVIRPADNKAYQVLYTSMKDASPTMLFQVRLVELQGVRFADVMRNTAGWTIPGHCFAKVALAGDTLKFSFLDSDWLKEQIQGLKQGELTVLPDSTASLQQMVSKYANEPRALDAETEFQRLH